MLQFVKRSSRFKRHVLSDDSEEPIKRRKYFHSRRHVPRMTSIRDGFDSDDETDENWKIRVSDQLLDEFSDIARPEKLVMMMWNHFVAKQPIYSESMVEQWAVHFFRTRLQMIRKFNLEVPSILHVFNLYDNSLLRSCVVDYCIRILREGERGD